MSRRAIALGSRRVQGSFKMDLMRKLHVRADEFARGQTMAEYALILAAVAVVVYAGYQIMGTSITTLLTSVDSKL